MEKPNQRLAKFDREFKHVDLARYYQLKKGTYESIELDKEVIDSCIHLTLRYRKRKPCPVFDLPPEMMAKIRSYLTYTIVLKFKIHYSIDYPFSPPIWFMKGVTHTIPNQVNLTDYYCYKVNAHNSQYVQYLIDGISNTSWSPAMSIEKDILSFLEKINHFDEMMVNPHA
jgi:hypothetical protein